MQLTLSSSPQQFLRLLLWLRLAAILGQSLTLAIVWRVLHVALPLQPMLLTIGVLAIVAALSAVRLRTALPPTQLEIAVQLLLDVAQLTALLYLSGGTTNPFASLYLVPIALAAVGLGWRYLTAIALVCVASYGWLMRHFVALDYPQTGVPQSLDMAMPPGAMPSGATMAQGFMGGATSTSPAFDLHLAGMQITFMLCCALLAGALSIMAAELRRRDRIAAALREEALRNEHLSAMGILAAGAAHELSTPLLSMSLLVEELQAGIAIGSQSRADLDLLSRQIQLCKDKLTALLQSVRRARAPALRAAPLEQLLRETLDQWRLMRPTMHMDVQWQPGDDIQAPQHAPQSTLLRVDAGFSQALISLLDNAADASASAGSDRIALSVATDAREVRITIEDEGPGLAGHLQSQIGKALFSTKAHGFGLGLVLSHANLNRLQGEVHLTPRREGGTRTSITLPLHSAS